MKIDIEENLINPSERPSTILINNDIKNLLDTDEGKYIKEDMKLLEEMGFEKKMINKVYILLRPINIQNAIEYMIEIDNKYQHNFIPSSNPEQKYLCFICEKPKEYHMDYNHNELSKDKEILSKFLKNILKDKDNNNENNDDNELKCEVCFGKINEKDKEFNKINCEHLFCTQCWFNYLKTLIIEAKVDKIKCMKNDCNEIISKEFILKHISEDNILVEKYNKFLKRNAILKDKNKKLCPKPDCDSFLEKNDLTKYVVCENGHGFCFECLNLPHGRKPCSNGQKNFMQLFQGKKMKRCPNCHILTEKNNGCDNIKCVNCQYHWCWICQNEYKYGHYDREICKGLNIRKIIKLKDAFGLNKLFPCICPRNQIPINNNSDKIWQNYVGILVIWFFGVFILNIGMIANFSLEFKIFKNKHKEPFWIIIFLLFDINYFIVFQISFTILTTPFILICIIYPKFLGRFLLFLGIGIPLKNV